MVIAKLVSKNKILSDRICSILKYTNSNKFIFFFCGLLGALFFMLMFGTAILDVTYTDWIMVGVADLKQSYVLGCMFGKSGWHFPVMADNIVYPFKESVVCVGGIHPFLTMLLKLFSYRFVELQFFGLYAMAVYFLQGAISGLIIKKLTGNSFYSIIASVFFILSTTMMQRIFLHDVLCAHYIILLCIYVCITRDKIRSVKMNTFIWGGLFFLAIGTFFYFVPMVLIFAFFYFLRDYLETRRLDERLEAFCLSLGILFVLMFFLGGFATNTSPQGWGLGVHGMNLNSLFNPCNTTPWLMVPFGEFDSKITSKFLKNLPITSGQYEGYGYLGFGMLLASFLVFCFAIEKFCVISSWLKNKENVTKIALVTGIVITFLIFALSPIITFNEKIIVHIDFPSMIVDVLSIFRSTGRFVFVLQYLIMSVVLWFIYRRCPGKCAVILLFVLLVFQWFDLKDPFRAKGEWFKQKYKWQTELQAPEWKILTKEKKHIFFADGGWPKENSFLDLAIKNNLTISDAYIGRKNDVAISKFRDEEMNRVFANNADKEYIYVFSRPESARVYQDYLQITTLDGVIIGVKK